MFKITYKAGPYSFFQHMLGAASNVKKVAAHVGSQMTREYLRYRFLFGGMYGWSAPNHRRGKTMIDTGRLSRSMAYNVQGGIVNIGTDVVYGRMLNAGSLRASFWRTSVIKSRGKLMTVPNAKVLGPNRARSAQASDFPNAKRGMITTRYGKIPVLTDMIRGKRQVIFFLRRSVRIEGRPYLYWSGEVKDFANDWMKYVLGKGTLRNAAMKGGRADVGSMRGGRPR